jgi:NADH-quinone oxidoreductase E subunit
MVPSFTFSSENREKIKVHMAKYPAGRQASAVLAALDLGQRQNGGWVSQGVIEEVARILEMPPLRVHEVATFYTLFNLKPVGTHHIQVCGTTPCWLRGADELKETCQTHLHLQEGDVSEDGQFSWHEVECLGACVNAPVVQINDDYYEDLTPELLIQVIEKLAQGKPIQSAPSEPVNRPSRPRQQKKVTDAE